MKTLLFILTLSLTLGIAQATPIPIAASSVRGVALGPYKAGDVVTVRYQDGKWSRRPFNPLESPETTLWDQLRVVIYWESVLGERKVLGFGSGTYEIKRDGWYYARMAEPRESGVGVVFYEVKKIESKD